MDEGRSRPLDKMSALLHRSYVTPRARHRRALHRARHRSEDPAPEQAVLPVQSLADLDFRLLHRAGAADLRSLRARLRPAPAHLAGVGAGWHGDRRPARPAAGLRAGAVHHPLHRGSPEPAVSPRLLHDRVGRGRRVRGAEHRRPRLRGILTGEWRLKQMYEVAYFPIAGTIWLLGALGHAAARQAIDARAKDTSAATSTDRCGRSRSRSRCCGCCGRCCRRRRVGDASSSSCSSASSRSSATCRGSGCCRARGRSSRASWPCRTDRLDGLYRRARRRRRSSICASAGGTTTSPSSSRDARTAPRQPDSGRRLRRGARRSQHRAAAHLAGAARRHRPRPVEGCRGAAGNAGAQPARRFAAADACRCRSRTARSTRSYCVAVLQHIDDVDTAVAEFARVTTRSGRVVAVEPDNARAVLLQLDAVGTACVRAVGAVLRRRWPVARRATDSADRTEAAERCSRATASSRSTSGCFPSRRRMLGAPPPSTWQARREAVESALTDAPDPTPRRGSAASTSTRSTRTSAKRMPPGRRFVEIQNTMLFATVGQKVLVEGHRRLGRVRAVLRLGERAHAGPARRAVLAEPRAASRRPGARARLRHRPHLAAARPRRRAARRHRSLRADAGARPSARDAGAPRTHASQLVRGDIRFICRLPTRQPALLDGDGAVRHPAVAAARARSDGDARASASGAASRAAPSASSSWPTCRRGRNTGSASA